MPVYIQFLFAIKFWGHVPAYIIEYMAAQYCMAPQAKIWWFLEPKTEKKVDLSEVSKTQNCLIFLDFLPDIVEKSIVRYFY